MFRKKTPEDISREDWKKYIEPHHDMVETYIRNYVIPDYCAFYIASAYRHEIEEENYDIFINSALCFFNVDESMMNRLKDKEKITEILNIKYGLIVTNETPLKLKEYSVNDL